ncbi:PAS/PAC sensor signal transduction histidine kinase [Halopseudomonas litoralis]|uniref:Phosphate regulon sensor protein PhoR n=1 Tax=Halopseudomonas litoralis TaxID=797277 RepID=A0A1H1WNC8_9GAMM|nr:PAS/PAC sensor signal transduction histidine kinase [Halopseudomonas litoralis]
MEKNWFRAITGKLFWLLMICLLIGLVVGQPAWALAIGLSGYLIWMLRQLQRFQLWLQAHPSDPPPEAPGLWGEIFDGIYRMQRRDKRLRARMQSVIERIQSSTAALSDGVVMIDKDGHLEWWNHAAEDLLGLRAPDDSGQHVHNLLRDPRFIDYFDQGSYREPLDIPSPVNISTWLQYNITRYGNGERLLLVRDVTRLHNLEQMRKDFVANVSHELRTPLTVVVGYLETMIDSDDGSNSRWQRPLHQMQQQARRMQSLLNDLLMLSRLETAEATTEEKPVDIALMLPGIRKDALALSGDRQHEITIENATQVRLTGLEMELRSAISNLVYNAVKYTQDGGSIQVSWSQDDRGARFSVTDNGPGISPEHLHRLTERFYRVDSSRNSTTGGTGLGLAIVKHVLMRHEGELQITSTVGKGSTFTCVFPPERLI